MNGLLAAGAPDSRPWLNHGRWPQAQGSSAPPTRDSHEKYIFLPVEGESLHQIPVGPVHAGIIEPGHFRFTANGETVVRLEERLGYVHKGIEGLMAGAPLAQAARLAGRVSGTAPSPMRSRLRGRSRRRRKRWCRNARTGCAH